jgi:hypothetical protein
MVKASEELAEIRVEHPVHLLAHDPDRQRVQRVMRGAPRPKPVRESEKVLLVDRVQHLDDRPLKDLVLQRRDSERSQPPVRLGDEHPPRRPRPIAPRMNPGVQIAKVGLEICPVVSPRHTVDPRRGLRADRPIRRPQPIDIDMVQERGEPCFLVRLCRSAHASQVTGRAGSGPLSGARFAGHVPLGRSPSLHRLRRPTLGVVHRLRRYYGIV